MSKENGKQSDKDTLKETGKEQQTKHQKDQSPQLITYDEPGKDEIHAWANFEIEELNLIPADAAVYQKKVPKYKEIKHYIKGEVLGRGKFGTVREFVDKYTLKRFAGALILFY